MRQNKNMIIREFIDSITVEDNVSANTIKAYASDLYMFKDWLDKNNLNLLHLDDDNIKSWLQFKYKQGMEATTVVRHAAVLRKFYDFLYRNSIMNYNPCLNLVVPKTMKKLPIVLSKSEIASLIKTAQEQAQHSAYGLRTLTMLEILYASGLRVSELCSLTQNDIMRGNKMMNITGKGDKQRMVPLTMDAQMVAFEYMKHRKEFLNDKDYKSSKNQWLFPSKTAKDGKITRQAVYKIMKALAFDSDIEHPYRVSPHVFRHSIATHMLDNGADLRVLQELLGHTDISTTQIYTHVTSDNLIKAVNNNHPLSHLKL